MSSTIWTFLVLSDPKFTKDKIFMTERYLVPFVMKSTSITINDRSCYGEELKIVIFTQELHIHNEIQTFLPEQDYNVTRKYFSKKSHWRWLPCLSEYTNHARRKESRDFNRCYYMASRSGLPAVSCMKNFPESHIINPLLTKFVRSRWLDIGLVLFFASLWTFTSSRSINMQ